MFKTKRKTLSIAALCALLSVTALSGCATQNSNTTYNEAGLIISDPFENYNRKVTSFNTAFDNAVTDPVIKGYRTVVPSPARTGVRNFLRNLGSPLTFANQVLQGDWSGAGDVIVRTSVNTFIGLGGLIDVAGHEGIEYEQEDFGQTLAVWGVDAGPYLVLPFIGPSSLRDYAGYAVGTVADPVRWYAANIDKDYLYYAKFGTEYLDLRESLKDTLEELEMSSLDSYAAIRGAYYQYRDAAIRDQDMSIETLPEIPDYDD